MSVETARAAGGADLADRPPHPDCSPVLVVWNEETRLERLLSRLQPSFERIVVCVQESTDRTLEIARGMARPGDVVVEDGHRGFAEASAPVAARAVTTEWAFVLAADEWPSDELLAGARAITGYARAGGYDGVWVSFRTTVEGLALAEAAGHPRILRRSVRWRPRLHSRPRVSRSLWWPLGYVSHDRSLDELVRDYLRYVELARGGPLLERHNVGMIRGACEAVAARDGWDDLASREWWPRVREVAFPVDPRGCR